MKIVIITDAWEPQVNGVVRTLKQTYHHLIKMGHDVYMITPEGFRTISCPSYPSISLALFPRKKIARNLNTINPDAIHIATEGPLGMAARRWCIKNNKQFTSSYHTQFPEYISLRLPFPLSWTYAWLRRFHSKAVHTLVPTKSQKELLQKHNFKNIEIWGRGVDTSLFTPQNPHQIDLPRPITLNMGRVSIEKNIDAFLSLDLPGSKIVVGDGPDLETLKQRYPKVLFPGAKFGKELASWVATADAFVFPSKTDTFGLVILEAMACGIPVAAYPVTGPKDIIKQGITGYMDPELSIAITHALELSSLSCLEFASHCGWDRCSAVFADLMYNNNTQQMKPDKEIIDPTYWCL